MQYSHLLLLRVTPVSFPDEFERRGINAFPHANSLSSFLVLLQRHDWERICVV